MQITFLPEGNRQVLQHSYPVQLQGRQSNLYSASYLQFGIREAHRLLQRQLIARALMAETTPLLEHPCLPRWGVVPACLTCLNFSEGYCPGVDLGEVCCPTARGCGTVELLAAPESESMHAALVHVLRR